MMNILRYYLIGINICAFIMRGMDKRIARANGARFEEAEEQGKSKNTVQTTSRISEKTLLIMMMLGGIVGAYLAMHFFRHKTMKGSFLWKFWSIVVVWISVIGYVLWLYS